MPNYRILAINPGSTSTKLAMFDGDACIFQCKAELAPDVMATFSGVNDQFDYRRDTILRALEERAVDLESIDAFVGRGGGLFPCPGGTYEINERAWNDSRGDQTTRHDGALGTQLAYSLAKEYGKQAYFVNSPDADEMAPVARVTGLADVYRVSRFHTLNHKETAIRDAKAQGSRYEDMNYIVAHIGGGVSVAAHRHGQAVDATDIVGGDSPMAPTRSGTLPAEALINLCYSGNYTKKEMLRRINKTGGLMDHVGTSDLQELGRMVDQGDAYATLIYGAFAYQISKYIGAMSTVLHGKVDAILIGGGAAHDARLMKMIREMVEFLAPVRVYPGEFEMEAMAAGVMRVLQGEESPKVYTGEPVFRNFDSLKAEVAAC